MLLCSTVKPLRVSLVEPVAYLRTVTRVVRMDNYQSETGLTFAASEIEI